MRLRARALCGSTLAAAALSTGCAAPGAPADAGAVDASSARDRTLTYAIRAIQFDHTEDTEQAHFGFDLDGRNSTYSDPEGCLHADYRSSLDPDQNLPAGCTPGPGAACGGVDNTLPSMVALIASFDPTSDVDAEMRSRIEAGYFAWVVQLTGVDSLDDDPDITVRLLQVVPTATRCEQLFAAPWALLEGSLRVGGAGPEDAQIAARGAIVRGRVRVEFDESTPVPLALALGRGASLNVPLYSVRLRFDVSPAGGSAGNLGGRVHGADIYDTQAYNDGSYGQQNSDAIGGLTDLPRQGVCYEPTAPPHANRFGDLSIGVGFALVPAEIAAGTPVRARIAGTCGTGAPPPPYDAAPPDFGEDGDWPND